VHNETYKCYEIRDDLASHDQSEGRDLGNGDRGNDSCCSQEEDEPLTENEEGDISDSEEFS
jgi:hypothetical protein